MQLIDIFKRLVKEDKKLFIKAYKAWCLFLFNKSYGLDDNTLLQFILDITNSKNIEISPSEYTVYINHFGDIFYSIDDKSEYSTSSALDVKLHETIGQCQ